MMETKKVLIVGMIDSIHLARWLHQFINYEIKFVILPSKKFKKVHPDITKLLYSNDRAKYTLAKPYYPSWFLGFIDYGIVKFLEIFRINWRAFLLNRTLLKNTFSHLHAIEIQGAGYLCTQIPRNHFKELNLIITNYGNDIFYFQNFSNHLLKIKQVLSLAHLYSAECSRDYELAIKYGFMGDFLPLIPNSGGVPEQVFRMNTTPADKRNLIVAKCYGGELGLGHLIIESLSDFLKTNSSVEVLIHSVTEDLIEKSELLRIQFPSRVRIFTVKNKIPRLRLIEYLSKSRIYIGACKSDGISTSFLEAICLGAYPIQTNTSCAIDWINLGFKGSIVEPEKDSILTALEKAYASSELEDFRQINLNKGRQFLNFDEIKGQALQFYGLR